MSGRSAIVRKEKEKMRKEPKLVTIVSQEPLRKAPIGTDYSLEPYPTGDPTGKPSGYYPPSNSKPAASTKASYPVVSESVVSTRPPSTHTNQTRRSPSHDSAYARVKPPPKLNDCDGSRIEPSKLREITKTSRSWISSTLGRKSSKGKETMVQSQQRLSVGSLPSTSMSLSMSMQGEAMTYGPPGSATRYRTPLKIWQGGVPPLYWNHLTRDGELWDDKADTVIYIGWDTEHHGHRSDPLFRVDSEVLRSTGADFFLQLLRQGSLKNEDGIIRQSTFTFTGSTVSGRSNWAGSSSHNSRGGHSSGTPGRTSGISGGSAGVAHKYEICIPPNEGATGGETLLWNAKVRNAIAMLYEKPIVGLTLGQALSDLLDFLNDFMPAGTDNPAAMIQWLTKINIHNVKDAPETALEILIWSEKMNVRWLEGWKEAFVHMAGMYHRKEAHKSTFARVSLKTQTLLERAHYQILRRMGIAQDRLKSFSFDDTWTSKITDDAETCRKCFQNLEAFFHDFYKQEYGEWPPKKPDRDQFWLTRIIIQRMVKDFGLLYQYLVDMDAVWVGLGERSSRRLSIISSSGRYLFAADLPDLPMATILAGVDHELGGCPHIPHPFPRIPASYSPPAAPQLPSKKAKKLFGKASKTNQVPKETVKETSTTKMAATLSYGYASNVMVLSEQNTPNTLLDKFRKYEASLDPSKINPHLARRGHWILIYGVMQVLAGVSVDTPGLRYAEGVSYPLCFRLREKGDAFEPFPNAWRKETQYNAHEDSFCWKLPKNWAEDQAEESSGDWERDVEEEVVLGEFERVESNESSPGGFMVMPNPSYVRDGQSHGHDGSFGRRPEASPVMIGGGPNHGYDDSVGLRPGTRQQMVSDDSGRRPGTRQQMVSDDFGRRPGTRQQMVSDDSGRRPGTRQKMVNNDSIGGRPGTSQKLVYGDQNHGYDDSNSRRPGTRQQMINDDAIGQRPGTSQKMVYSDQNHGYNDSNSRRPGTRQKMVNDDAMGQRPGTSQKMVHGDPNHGYDDSVGHRPGTSQKMVGDDSNGRHPEPIQSHNGSTGRHAEPSPMMMDNQRQHQHSPFPFRGAPTHGERQYVDGSHGGMSLEENYAVHRGFSPDENYTVHGGVSPGENYPVRETGTNVQYNNYPTRTSSSGHGTQRPEYRNYGIADGGEDDEGLMEETEERDPEHYTEEHAPRNHMADSVYLLRADDGEGQEEGGNDYSGFDFSD